MKSRIDVLDQNGDLEHRIVLTQDDVREICTLAAEDCWGGLLLTWEKVLGCPLKDWAGEDGKHPDEKVRVMYWKLPQAQSSEILKALMAGKIAGAEKNRYGVAPVGGVEMGMVWVDNGPSSFNGS